MAAVALVSRRRQMQRVLSVLLALAALTLPAVLRAEDSGGGVTSKKEALRIARKALAQLEPPMDFAIHEKETVEKDFGWVFFYSPKGRGDSHAYGLNAVGGGPLVVERADGAWTFLGTTVPPEDAIELFETRWRRAREVR